MSFKYVGLVRAGTSRVAAQSKESIFLHGSRIHEWDEQSCKTMLGQKDSNDNAALRMGIEAIGADKRASGLPLDKEI